MRKALFVRSEGRPGEVRQELDQGGQRQRAAHPDRTRKGDGMDTETRR